MHRPIPTAAVATFAVVGHPAATIQLASLVAAATAASVKNAGREAGENKDGNAAFDDQTVETRHVNL
jgi:hypothetical protein